MMDCLEGSLNSLQVLETIISPSFGPNGLDLALKTETGCIIVTNSGHTILDSISLSHPVGRLILKMIHGHVKITGDNSKMFLIILSQLLKSVTQHTLIQSRARSQTSKLAGLSNACAILNNLRNFSSVLGPFSLKTDTGCAREFEKCIRGLTNTALNGKFSPKVVKILTEQIFQIINLHHPKTSELLSLIQHIIEEFSDICIQMHGIGISKSSVREGFLLQRETLGECSEKYLQGSIKFLCMNCQFDFEKIEFGQVQFSFDLDRTQVFTQIRVQILKKISKVLHEKGIKILLCKSSLPDYARSVLSQKFCIVENMDERDMERICIFFNILPVENIREILEEDGAMHTGVLCKAGNVIIGTQKFFSIVPERNIDSSRPCCHLILCAPSSGICQEYYKELLNAFKVLKMSFYENYGHHEAKQDHMICLPGAGSVEFLLAKYFQDVAFKSVDEDLQLVAGSLSQAMLSIPRSIHKISHRSAENAKFIDVLNQLEKITDIGRNSGLKELRGINGENGAIFKPADFDIIEPFSSKILLMDHILQAAQQIFKIDQIVASKTKHSDQ